MTSMFSFHYAYRQYTATEYIQKIQDNMIGHGKHNNIYSAL